MTISNTSKIQIEDAGGQSGGHSFDDALKLTKFGKFNVLVTIATGLSLMGAVLENVSVSLIMPFVKCDLHLTHSEQGLLTSVSFLGIVISSHFWGFMADTCGRVKVMRVAMILTFICSFLSAFSINTPMLLVLRFLVGLLASGVQAAAYSYVSEFHTKSAGPRAAAFASVFLAVMFLYLTSVAMILIPMDWTLYIYTLKFVPWRLYLIVTGSTSFFMLIVFCFLPESPRYMLQINEKEKTLEILKTMYACNTGNPRETFPVKEILPAASGRSIGNAKGFSNTMKLVWSQTKPIFVPPFLESTVKMSFVIFVLFAIGHGTFMWIPDFLVQLQNNIGSGKTLCEIVAPKSISNECYTDNKNIFTFQLLFVIGVLFTVSQTLVTFYLNRIGPKKLIAIWLIMSSLSSIAIVFVTEYYLDVIAIVIFTSCAVCAQTASALSVNLFTTNIRAMATCCIFMFGRLGGFFGSNLIAPLLEHSCTSIFYVYAVLLIMSIGVFLTIQPHKKQNIQSDAAVKVAE